MKGSYPRPADRCPFVLRHSISQVTSFMQLGMLCHQLMIVYSAVYSGADQRKHQSSTSLAFVQGIHRWPVNSPHKGPVTRKMFPFDDAIMLKCLFHIDKGLDYHCACDCPSNYLCYAISRYIADCKSRNYFLKFPLAVKDLDYIFVDPIFFKVVEEITQNLAALQVLPQWGLNKIIDILLITSLKCISLNIHILLILMKFHWQMLLSVYLMIKIYNTVWHWKARVIELICSVAFESSHLLKA